jgi:hypothetical protein
MCHRLDGGENPPQSFVSASLAYIDRASPADTNGQSTVLVSTLVNSATVKKVWYPDASPPEQLYAYCTHFTPQGSGEKRAGDLDQD